VTKAGPNSDARTFYYRFFLFVSFIIIKIVFSGLMFSAFFLFVERERERQSFVCVSFCLLFDRVV